MAKILLSLESVSKIYGLRLLYKDVTLDVEEGSIAIISGANGSGKSTLLRIMAGLSHVDSGKVHCYVEPEELGYLGHMTFLYPELTALENLQFWSKAQGKKVTETELLEKLAFVGIDEFAHDRVSIFSRGMSQRLNLARLLVQDAQLLLLDEPSTGLDVKSKELLHRCIQDFSKRGAGILWVSHSVGEDKAFAHRILHISDKKITELGVVS